MKSMPLTMRGPVDDENFTWMKSQPRQYASHGELGFRSLARSSHQRSSTTGSTQLTSSNFDDGRGIPILPKIATGRSAQSAKKLYKDYETIKIRSRIQNELENPQIPPLYVPKNPKPLYKHPVDEMKQFDILHFRQFAERGEVDPEELSDNSREFYAQITFLRNAVRNVDGTTSYQNLCKRPRSWSEPTPVDDQPGLIKGNRLHWQSASTAMQHPRMLLPLKPGPSTKWYAWKVDQRSGRDKRNKGKHAKDTDQRRREFVQAFSPRFTPHPTPAGFKYGAGHSDTLGQEQGEEKQKPMNSHGVTFITEDKEDRDDSTRDAGTIPIATEEIVSADPEKTPEGSAPAAAAAEVGSQDVENPANENHTNAEKVDKKEDAEQNKTESSDQQELDKDGEHVRGQGETGTEDEDQIQPRQSQEIEEQGESEAQELGTKESTERLDTANNAQNGEVIRNDADVVNNVEDEQQKPDDVNSREKADGDQQQLEQSDQDIQGDQGLQPESIEAEEQAIGEGQGGSIELSENTHEEAEKNQAGDEQVKQSDPQEDANAQQNVDDIQGDSAYAKSADEPEGDSITE